jgi:hypothetical protein
VLKDSVDHGIEIPDDVPLWVARYPQVCDDGTSERAQKAAAEAKNVMEKLYKAIIDHPIQELQGMVLGWRQEAGDPRNQQKMWTRAPAVLSEANVEAHEFRLEFAKETLQSFKRGRSSSLRRANVNGHLDALLNDHIHKISEQAIEIVELQEKIREKDRYIDSQNGILQTKTEMIALKQSVVKCGSGGSRVDEASFRRCYDFWSGRRSLSGPSD